VVSRIGLAKQGAIGGDRRLRPAPTVVVVNGSGSGIPVALAVMRAAPILAVVIGAAPADPALRLAFSEAARRGVAVLVLGVGPAAATDDIILTDQAQSWAGKYPGVPVTVSLRRDLDAAVTVTAASRDAGLLVLDASGGPAVDSIIRAVRRRARCPVVVIAAES